MDINASNIAILTTAVSAAYAQGFEGVESCYQQIATEVPSSTSSNLYPWLGKNNTLREWIGDRVVGRLKKHSYTIENKKFELTEGVPAENIEDDQYGIYSKMFEQMGQTVKVHPDKLIFKLLKLGFTELCYDGQPFFDADHPVGNEDDGVSSVSNMQAGANNPWYLLDTRKALKPLIYQNRRPFKFAAKNNSTHSDHVFMTDEFLYGVDGRSNVGFGLWQLGFGSKAVLDEPNFDAACEAMMSLCDDAGEPLGVQPSLLVVGPKNRAAARKLIEVANKDGGATNPNYKAVDLLVVPWLA